MIIKKGLVFSFFFYALLDLISAIEEFLSKPAIDSSSYKYATHWYEQTVDHFGFTINDTFNQRYLTNDNWWNKNRKGPIFFYTGNEGDIEAFAQNSGLMWELAPEFGALLVFAEHRYYGKSVPYGNASLGPNPKLNGFLTSEQALADYAELITNLKSIFPNAKESPVIAFGGSYGGMLAAWFRIKYPHICDGALAASAPVAQFNAPCAAFGRIVTSDYNDQSQSCASTIRKSWKAIDEIGVDDKGKAWLTEQFHLCSPLKSTSELKSYLNELWTNVAMMNYPYPTSFLMPLPGNPVKEICHKIDDFSDITDNDEQKRTISKITAGVQVYFNYTGTATCLKMSDPDQIGAGMWDLQSCTEMVMPMCFDGVNDMFEKQAWNESVFVDYCRKTWQVTPRTYMADMMYGGKKLNGASNIIFSNGLMDPWSSGGVLKDINKSVISLLIQEGAHHLDLRGSNPLDPPSVIKTRRIEKQHIAAWIAMAHKNWRKRSSLDGPSINNIVVL